MPRQVAPQPSKDEINVKLTKPWSGVPTETIVITGAPNSEANISRTQASNAGNEIAKTGTMGKDDVQELLNLIGSARGFPSHADKDIYGLDTKLEFTTFDIQWGNAFEDDAAAGEGGVKELGDETKDDFKRIVQSIEAAARQFAKQDKPV